MTSTATLVKHLSDFTGDARLYRCNPPMRYCSSWSDDQPDTETEFVVVSATVVPYSGPETYIFPATADGTIASWGELDGSFRGALDHEAALMGAGYEVDSMSAAT